MHRHLPASALALAALAAPFAALAQGATLYGLVDLALRRDDTGSAHQTAMRSGSASGSRLGFRGSEDLGGGLSVRFTLEAGIDAETGAILPVGAPAGSFFGRTATLALASPQWGSLSLGRQYSPIFLLAYASDPFAYAFVGNWNNALGLQGGTLTRVSRAAVYTSPAWQGLQVALLYGFGEPDTDGERRATQRGLSLRYKAGPLQLGYALQNTQGVAGAPLGHAQRRQLLGAVYDAGPLKLHAGYGKNARVGASGAAAIDRDGFAFGISMPVAPLTFLYAQFQSSRDRTATRADVRQLSLALSHYLSKRTDLYIAAAASRNSRTATFAISDASGTVGTVLPGDDPRAWTLGLRHRF
jgi:predicted porin